MLSPILLVSLLNLFTNIYSQYLQEYDRCTADNDRCKDIQSCTELHEPIRKGFRPRICSYNGERPIVCCTTKVEQVITNRNGYEPSVSEMMCLIYLEDICSSTIQSAVGGSPAEPKELPFMARIGYESLKRVRWLCGGTLISTNFVLSAAHCSQTIGTPRWLRLGELDAATDKDDARPEDFRIVQIIDHPDYKRNRRYYDITLYRLERHVVFNEYIQPICLYQSDTMPANRSAIAAGWGRTESGKLSSKLLKVNLELYDIDRCNNLEDANRMPNGLNDDSQICSGLLTGGRDTCDGDSGGPLYLPSINKQRGECVLYTQIGLTSFGPTSCGRKGYGAVYTKISAYRGWIESIVWNKKQTSIPNERFVFN